MWSRFHPDKLQEAEKTLIELSSVSITSVKVPIENFNYIYCLNCGDPSNPPMVLLHGYGGSGLIFFKILKELSKSYYLYIVDHLGMGHSTRPRFEATGVLDTEDFFTDAFEQFRIQSGLERFILVGHSFGGYIAGCYTIKYPQHIEKLLFLSTVGISTIPEGYDYVKELRGDWKSRWIQKILMVLWVKRVPPAKVLRSFGPISHFFLGGLMSDRAGTLTKIEEHAIKTYLEQINLLPGSGEYAINNVMYPGAWGKYPLCERMQNLKVPMAFFYGDHDWVASDGADQVALQTSAKVQKYIISNSDHHLYWDNPSETVEKMLNAIATLE